MTMIICSRLTRGGGSKKDKLAVLFEEWMKCSEDWSQSDFIVRMRESRKDSMKGGRRWMTEADIANKYLPGRTMGEAKTIAREIVQGKENCPHMKANHIKPHPNLPTRQDMRLFLVWDEAYETSQTDTVVESLFQCRDDGKDSKKGKHEKSKKKDKKRKVPDSSSSDSESCDSESSDSSSSSSQAKKKKKKKKKKTSKKSACGKGGKKKAGKLAPKPKPSKKESSSGSCDDDDEDEEDLTPSAASGKDTKKGQKEKKALEKERKQREKEAQKEVKRQEAEEKKEKTKMLTKKRSLVKKVGEGIASSVHQPDHSMYQSLLHIK